MLVYRWPSILINSSPKGINQGVNLISVLFSARTEQPHEMLYYTSYNLREESNVLTGQAILFLVYTLMLPLQTDWVASKRKVARDYLTSVGISIIWMVYPWLQRVTQNRSLDPKTEVRRRVSNQKILTILYPMEFDDNIWWDLSRCQVTFHWNKLSDRRCEAIIPNASGDKRKGYIPRQKMWHSVLWEGERAST